MVINQTVLNVLQSCAHCSSRWPRSVYSHVSRSFLLQRQHKYQIHDLSAAGKVICNKSLPPTYVQGDVQTFAGLCIHTSYVEKCGGLRDHLFMLLRLREEISVPPRSVTLATILTAANTYEGKQFHTVSHLPTNAYVRW